MIRKSHDYDFLGAISSFPTSYFTSKEAFNRKTRLIYFTFFFISWTEKEYGRLAYAQGIRWCRSVPFFYERKKRHVGYISKQGRESLVKGIPF